MSRLLLKMTTSDGQETSFIFPEAHWEGMIERLSNIGTYSVLDTTIPPRDENIRVSVILGVLPDLEDTEEL